MLVSIGHLPIRELSQWLWNSPVLHMLLWGVRINWESRWFSTWSMPPTPSASWRFCLQKELPLKVTLLGACWLANVERPFPEEVLYHAKFCCCKDGYGIRVGRRGERRKRLAKSLGLLINKLWLCFSNPFWSDTHCVRDSICVLCKPWGELLLRDWFGLEDDFHQPL